MVCRLNSSSVTPLRNAGILSAPCRYVATLSERLAEKAFSKICIAPASVSYKV